MSSPPPPPPVRTFRPSSTGRTATIVGTNIIIKNADGTEKERKDITGITPTKSSSGEDVYKIKKPIPTKPYLYDEEEYTINTNGNYKLKNTVDSVKPISPTTTIDGKSITYTIPEDTLSVKENQDLLEIFDKGINDIVLSIKAKFGSDNQQVNSVVNAISTILQSISTDINKEELIANDDYGATKLITKKDNDGKYTSEIKDGKQHREYSSTQIQFDQIERLRTSKSTVFQNLNTGLGADYTVLNSTDANDTLDLNDQNAVDKLNTRLANCQALEISYLDANAILHSVGAFTKTLFEKYMYVTNVMLYLLKNLVNKPKLSSKTFVDSGCVGANQTVTLPKAIIKNVAQLIGEQSKLKDSIDMIELGLTKTNMDNMYNFANLAIDTDLKATTSPSNPSVPVPPHVSATSGNITTAPVVVPT
jgi:hypothetical protein